MSFSIVLQPRNKECSVLIQTAAIELMLRRNGMTDFEKNTEFVAEVLEGLKEFNRHWPLLPFVRFCSDIGAADATGFKRSFAIKGV